MGDGAGLGRLTSEQIVNDVIASHELAGFTFDDADRQRLLAIAEGRLSADDAVAAIIREATSTTSAVPGDEAIGTSPADTSGDPTPTRNRQAQPGNGRHAPSLTFSTWRL